MRHSTARGIVAGVAVVLSMAAVARPAHAVKQFYVELEAKYAKPDSRNPNDIALVAALEQARCTVCHPRDDKHKLTAYGGQLAVRINKFDKKNKKKIRTALEEVGALQSDAQDPKSPTYDELFRQGKLPPTPAR